MTCLRWIGMAMLLAGAISGCRSAPRQELTVDWVTTLERANAILGRARDSASIALARDQLLALEHGRMRSIRVRADALGSRAGGPVDPQWRARLEAEQQRFALAVDRLLGYGREVPDELRLELQRLRPVFSGTAE